MTSMLTVLENAAGVDANGYPLSAAADAKVTEARADALEARVKARLFSPLAKFAKPEPVFHVNGIAISTAGNLTAISAAVKTGKSAFVSAMIASTMADPEARRDLLGVTSSNPNGYAVLHIDTEQSLYDHHELCMRTIARAGLTEPPAWFRSCCLTGFHIAELGSALPMLLESAKADFGAIHSVFIDGVGDLVQDVNDAAESNAFIAELHSLAIQQACPVLAIIHVNPNGEKTRGHLGSQLERKAETNLRLEKDGDITVVWSDKNRRAPIPKNKGPRFEWSDKHGMHVSTESGGSARAAAKKAKHRSVAESIFLKAGRESLPWGEFLDRLKDLLRISSSGARKRQEAMSDAGVIEKDVTGEWRLTK